MRGSSTRPREERPAAGEARAGRTWLAVGAGAAFLAVFVFIAYEVHAGTLVNGWDARATEALVAFRSGGWSRVFWAATLLGNAPLMAAYLSTALILFLAWGKWGAVLLLGVGTGLAQVGATMAKAVMDRPRPPVALALIEQPGSHSLPSGHAFMTLVVAGLLLHLLYRRTERHRSPVAGAAGRRTARVLGTSVAAALLLLVGVSRVYLGVHWASDVIAGWCLGAFWLILVLGSLRRWRWDERLPAGPHPLVGRGRRIGVLAVMVVIVLIAGVLTAWADPLL